MKNLVQRIFQNILNVCINLILENTRKLLDTSSMNEKSNSYKRMKIERLRFCRYF